MLNSFPIQKKWLDDVKDTMKPEEFAELNYRINIYALYGEEVALTDNRYVQGYFNSIKSQIDNMNKKYKKVGRPGIFTEEEQDCTFQVDTSQKESISKGEVNDKVRKRSI